MLEGKKISELDLATQLPNDCCFPVLTSGETKRITYGSLLSQIENDLPESEIEQVKEDLATLKNRTNEAGEKINNLEMDVDNLKNEFDIVDEMVQGQNATINNCVSTVNDIEQTINETHFDDVLELEEQVRANTANIERKQAQLNISQMQAVNSGITAEKVRQYDNMTSIEEILNKAHPKGYVYTQWPDELSPIELDLYGTWTDISYTKAGLFIRVLGGDSAAFGEIQAEGLPNITGTVDGLYGEKNVGSTSGAFGVTIGRSKISSANWENGRGTDFDASRSNDIYGNSDHVTPVNTAIKVWKRTA